MDTKTFKIFDSDLLDEIIKNYPTLEELWVSNTVVSDIIKNIPGRIDPCLYKELILSGLIGSVVNTNPEIRLLTNPATSSTSSVHIFPFYVQEHTFIGRTTGGRNVLFYYTREGVYKQEEKKSEEDHTGMIYNPYSDRWGFL
jgi:hypothetical protein